MSNGHVTYLLIGGGVTSSAAAQAIRQLDEQSSMMLVGQEVVRPYHRPPLSAEFLSGRMGRGELFALKPDWFSENQVQFHSGVRVVHLDTVRRCVTLDNGQEVSFDKALIAVGAVPRHLSIPGANLPNIQYLRTLADAERLLHLVEKAKAEGRPHPRGRGKVVVVGGGLLGVELSATLTQLGLEATLLAAAGRLWSKFAGEATGRFLAKYMEKRGVRVFTERPPQRLEGDGRVQRVVLSPTESIECDFVAAAIGVTLNKEILRGTPILVEKAILTDDHARTNVPDIYAAGDCAAIFDPLFGKHRTLDHWDGGRITGALAGRNMAGADEGYRAVNRFSSHVFDVEMSAWGERRMVTHRLLRGTPNVDEPDFVEIGVDAAHRVAQVVAINHRGEDELLAELVRQRVNVDGREEAIKDPGNSLESLVK